jgi:hypothetical protein
MYWGPNAYQGRLLTLAWYHQFSQPHRWSNRVSMVKDDHPTTLMIIPTTRPSNTFEKKDWKYYWWMGQGREQESEWDRNKTLEKKERKKEKKRIWETILLEINEGIYSKWREDVPPWNSNQKQSTIIIERILNYANLIVEHPSTMYLLNKAQGLTLQLPPWIIKSPLILSERVTNSLMQNFDRDNPLPALSLSSSNDLKLHQCYSNDTSNYYNNYQRHHHQYWNLLQF